MRPFLLISSVCATLAIPATVDAFCGFYVSGASGEMFNNATQVVLMREGTRTVLSMQNNYQGPPENFAMVVPVPQVLQKENVKTLDKAIFERIDRLAAPRLVEYWEQDPCAVRKYKEEAVEFSAVRAPAPLAKPSASKLGVTIEAQFKVGEYEIVILSAKDSTGLDTWLRQENYQIPKGAEPLLRPYVETGSKFFVAKVDTAKVTFKDGMAMLSPLRFYYDSDEFSLPIRLGMINSSGTQDLIVHILAKGKRYEVANYKNVTIPTNLDVKNEVRARFGEFYAALFDATLEKNPGAVVTEYSWDAATCDPCPTPALNSRELATLGNDVLYAPMPTSAPASIPAGKPASPAPPMRKPMPPRRWSGFVLTRLHARYGKNDMANDLIFKQATAIVGGREFGGPGGAPEKGAKPSSKNSFQGRYAIRHEWTGKIECKNPVRGVWGGPPGGHRANKIEPAVDLAFAPRGKTPLASFVKRDIPELGVATASGQPPTTGTDTAGNRPTDTNGAQTPVKPANTAPKSEKKNKGCQASHATHGAGTGLFLALLWLGFGRRRSTSRVGQ